MHAVDRVKCTCVTCGKIFLKRQLEIDKHNSGKYCSRECQGIAQIGTTRKSRKVLMVCATCGVEFFVKPKTIKAGGGKYCSKQCTLDARKSGQYKKCKICGKEFYVANGRMDIALYCSKKCYYDSKVTRTIKKCPICDNEFFIVPSDETYNTGKYCSKKCSGISHRSENYDEIRNLRSSSNNKKWRLDVFKRDNFTCKKCNIKKSGYLNAHHIIPVSRDLSLMFDVSNGITLCVECHKEEHAKIRSAAKISQQIDIFSC